MNRVVLVLRAARQLDLFAGGAVQLQLEVRIRKRLRRDDRMLTAGRRLFPFLLAEERRSRGPRRPRPAPPSRPPPPPRGGGRPGWARRCGDEGRRARQGDPPYGAS